MRPVGRATVYRVTAVHASRHPPCARPWVVPTTETPAAPGGPEAGPSLSPSPGAHSGAHRPVPVRPRTRRWAKPPTSRRRSRTPPYENPCATTSKYARSMTIGAARRAVVVGFSYKGVFLCVKIPVWRHASCEEPANGPGKVGRRRSEALSDANFGQEASLLRESTPAFLIRTIARILLNLVNEDVHDPSPPCTSGCASPGTSGP